jgi:probable rRNA maturation factor
MLSIDVFNGHRTRRVASSQAVRYVRRVLRTARVRNARVSIVFVDSRYSRRINRRYLNHDHVTDVISFPLENGAVLEGEVYVNLDRARAQARVYGVSFSNEVARLVIHGTLHLVGYDDSTEKKAERMKAEEDYQVCYWFH